MMIKILLVLGVAVGGLLVYAALKDARMGIAREVSVKAGTEIIFPYLNNSEKMNEWMPWKDSDPGVNMIYSGPTDGVGSLTSWDSTGKMGTGSAEIIESIPNQLVKSKIAYTKPMVMSQIATMALIPNPNGEVTVRWSVTGNNSFFFRLIGTFVSMDKMVGGEFQKGLSTLKKLIEERN